MVITVVKAENTENFDLYYRKYLGFVSGERASRIERIRSEKDKVLSLLAGLLIRTGIKERFGIDDDEISFVYGEQGKPFLKGYDDFDFSVSHAGNCVAFVCSDSPVGVDIEKRKRGNEKIASRYFQDTEYRKIYEENELEFADIWTAKEAYIKMTGRGLSQGLDTFNVIDGSSGCRFSSFRIDENYTVTVCTKKTEENIEITELSESELLGKYE